MSNSDDFQTCYKEGTANVRVMMPVVDISPAIWDVELEWVKKCYNDLMDVALDRSIKDAKALIAARKEVG